MLDQYSPPQILAENLRGPRANPENLTKIFKDSSYFHTTPNSENIFVKFSR